MAGDLITDNWQIEYDGVLFGSGTGQEIVTMDLFSSPRIRTNDIDRPQGHGQYEGDDWYSARTFTMDVEVWASSAVDLQQRIDQILRATTIKSKPLPMVVRADGRDDILLYARPTQRTNVVDISMSIGFASRFSLQWRANDPRLYSNALNSEQFNIATVVTGGRFDASFPYSFGGPSADGEATVVNTGNWEAQPVITVSGPITNPTIDALSPSGVRSVFSITGEIPAGSDMIVDTDARTVTLDGASIYNRITQSSTWFAIEPGITTVGLTGQATDTATSAVITWRSATI